MGSIEGRKKKTAKSSGEKKRNRDADGLSGAVELSDEIDLESGTITVDTSAPETTVSTSEILQEKDAGAGDALIKGQAGKVYILDLKPIFKAIGTTTGEKPARSLVRFCETLLSRTIGHDGTYTCQDDEIFFFQLKKSDGEGLRMASKIVNELGVQFLRGGFKAEELISEVLGVVDAADAMGEDGRIDPDKSLQALSREQERDLELNRIWAPTGEVEEVAEATQEWHEGVKDLRPAGKRVKRDTQRRKKKRPIAGPDRRRKTRGRRDTDKSNASVW